MDSGITPTNTEDITDIEVILDNLALSLSKTVNLLLNKNENRSYDGIIILFDECDQASTILDFGTFLKSLSEGLSKYDCSRVMFVVCGLPKVQVVIKDSHESALRIFQPILVDKFNLQEVSELLKNGIMKASSLNEVHFNIETDTIEYINHLSSGYPHMTQQLAFDAFENCENNTINKDSVDKAVFSPNGSIDKIGQLYYSIDYNSNIKSDEYRSILKIMAKNLDEWTTKAIIKEKFIGNTNTLNNALRLLTERGIIIKNPSKIAEYRLPEKGFAIWIRLFSENK